MLSKLEDTRCHNNYGRPHSVNRSVRKVPMYDNSIGVGDIDEPPSNPTPIKYTMRVTCSICHKSAYIDQDDNLIETQNGF